MEAMSVLSGVLLTCAMLAEEDPGRKVLDLFHRRCVECHGEEKQSGKLRLDSFEHLRKGSKSGPVVMAGKSGESLLVELVEAARAPGSGGKRVMPPPKAGPPLAPEEVELIRAWIDGGLPPQIKAPPADLPTVRNREESLAPGLPPAGPGTIAALAFSPDGGSLVKGGFRSAEILDARTGERRAGLEGPADLVRAAAFAPGGGLLALAGGAPGRAGEVKVFDLPALLMPRTIAAHEDSIYAVAFSPDGKRIATSSYDRTVKLWDADTLAETATLRDHIDAVYGLAFHPPGGERLASCAADRTVKVWEVASGSRIHTLSDATDALHALAFHPRGSHLAAGGADRMLRVWKLDPAGGELARSAFAHKGSVLRLFYSPDGARIYTAGEDRLIKAWDSATLSERMVFEPQSDWPLALALSPAGDKLAAGRYDGSWSIYDAETGAVLSSSGSSGPGLSGSGLSGLGRAAPRDEFQVSVVDGGNVTVPPSLSTLSLRGASRGSTLTATIEGRNLAEAEVVSSGKGITVRVLQNEALPRPEFRRTRGNTGAEIVDHSVPHRLKVEISIAPDAPAGVHSILARTPLGATNGISFQVDALPEVPEKEPNDPAPAGKESAGQESAGQKSAGQEIRPGTVLAGKVDQSGDVDAFRFQASAGQELVFDLVASAIGSGLNGLLTLHDAEGKELASSARFAPGRTDARLAFRFQESGRYTVRLSDRDFRAGLPYRLRVGEFPLVTAVFPLGLERGTEAVFRVEGFNLGGSEPEKTAGKIEVKIAAPADAPPGLRIPVPLPSDLAADFIGRYGPPLETGLVSVGDAPETHEAEKEGEAANDSPAAAERAPRRFTANGAIGRGRDDPRGPDVDIYRFPARKGERLLIDIEAQRLGSALDPFIEVLAGLDGLDGGGRPIERAVLRPSSRSFITLADRDARTPGLRIETWPDLRLNDHVFLGSEVLRVRALPDYPDEDVTFFARGGARVGFLDTTPGFQAVGNAVYKVEIHPPGAKFPQNGMPLFHLHYRNDDGGAFHGRDSLIHFEAPADGEYLVRVADALGGGGPGHAYRLAVREPRPDFRFAVDAGNPNVPAGGLLPLNARVERLDDFEGEVQVEVAGLPPGFRAFTAPVLPGEESAAFSIEALTGARSTAPDFSFRVLGRARIGDREVVREARGGMITVTPPADVALVSEPRELEIVPGGTVKVTVRVERRNGFRARVPLDVPNLPHGVYVMDTGLNGILVTEKESERSYLIHAEPWVKPFTRTFFSTAIVETRSVPSRHAAPPQTLRLKARKPSLAKF